MNVGKVKNAPVRLKSELRKLLLGNALTGVLVHRLCHGAPRGSTRWLIGKELQYGGLQTRVPRKQVSELDPRDIGRLRSGGMTGGDRMLVNGYASSYARYLRPYLNLDAPITLVEVGILRGTGLAIWCDLFPAGRVIGLDVDLSHVQANHSNLRDRGAFSEAEPELHLFDQFEDNAKRIGHIIGDDTVDIAIDDGFHSIETIMGTLRDLLPLMSERFVYFVEDHRTVHRNIKSAFPDLAVFHSGAMTVVSRGLWGHRG